MIRCRSADAGAIRVDLRLFGSNGCCMKFCPNRLSRVVVNAGLAGLLSVAVTGCPDDQPNGSSAATDGGPPISPATAGMPRACQLLTSDDVKEVLKADVGVPKDGTAGNFYSCFFTGPDGAQPWVNLLLRMSSFTRANFETSVQANVTELAMYGPAPVPVPVSNVGEAAYSVAGTLLAWANSREITVLVTGSQPSAVLDAEVALAVKAFARLSAF